MNIADIEALLHKPKAPLKLRSPIIIYGAGNFGRRVLRVLRESGYTVAAFIDQRAGLTPIDGVAVLSLTDFEHHYHLNNYAVAIAVHNAYCDLNQIFTLLKKHHIKNIITPFDLIKLFPMLAQDAYWLGACSLLDHWKNITAAAEVWHTPADREYFLQLLSFRITGDYAALPAPSLRDQYMPDDLPRWRDPMRLIDAGAYDGDTLRNFSQNGYLLQAAMCFEPDPDNFRLLQKNTMGQISITCMQMGLGERTEQLRFDCRNGMGSTIDPTGGTIIDITTIDSVAANFAPTLIKMDIEGAEQNALRGAEQVIRRYRPDLAISLYHCPDDLWAIPLWVQRLNLGYRLHLRTHLYSSFETVLYAYAS